MCDLVSLISVVAAVRGRLDVDHAVLFFELVTATLGDAADEEGHDQNENELEAQNDRVGYDDDVDAVALDDRDGAVRAAVDGHGLHAAPVRQGLVEVGGRGGAAALEQLRHESERVAQRVELGLGGVRVPHALDGDVERAAELALHLGGLDAAHDEQHAVREEQQDEDDLVEDEEEAVGAAGADQAHQRQEDDEGAEDEQHERDVLDRRDVYDRADLRVRGHPAQHGRVGPLEQRGHREYAQAEEQEDDVDQAEHDANERAEATCVLAHFFFFFFCFSRINFFLSVSYRSIKI